MSTGLNWRTATPNEIDADILRCDAAYRENNMPVWNREGIIRHLRDEKANELLRREREARAKAEEEQKRDRERVLDFGRIETERRLAWLDAYINEHKANGTDELFAFAMARIPPSGWPTGIDARLYYVGEDGAAATDEPPAQTDSPLVAELKAAGFDVK